MIRAFTSFVVGNVASGARFLAALSFVLVVVVLVLEVVLILRG